MMDTERTNNTPHWFPLNWTKRKAPLLGPSPHHFVSRNIYEPSVLYDGTTHLMLFRGESQSEPPTSCVGRLGIGFSPNGTDFRCQGEPALVPDSPYEARGMAHPRLTLAGGVFLLTYSAFDGSRYRLCLATSVNLRAWFRHGPIFPNFEDNDGNTLVGTILPQYSKDGGYFMYVGAGDLYVATSADLLNWEISEKPILKREDCPNFASRSLEPGPSPFLTKDGLILILNGTDDRNHIVPFACLLEAGSPDKCLAHLKEPFMQAEHDWEMFGYLPYAVRATGLSLLDNKFHLYYSGADRCIGMATAPVPSHYLPWEEKEEAEEESKQEEGEEKPKICGV